MSGREVLDRWTLSALMEFLTYTEAVQLQALSRREYNRNVPRCVLRWALNQSAFFVKTDSNMISEVIARSGTVNRVRQDYQFQKVVDHFVQVGRDIYWLHDKTWSLLKNSGNAQFSKIEKREMINARNTPALCNVLNKYIIVSGGEINTGEDSGIIALDTVEKYDIIADEWQGLPSMNQARVSHAMSAIGYRVFAICGLPSRFDEKGVLSSIECLDISHIEAGWSDIEYTSDTFIGVRNSPAVATLNDRQILILGGALQGRIDSSDANVLDVVEGTVLKVCQIPMPQDARYFLPDRNQSFMRKHNEVIFGITTASGFLRSTQRFVKFKIRKGVAKATFLNG